MTKVSSINDRIKKRREKESPTSSYPPKEFIAVCSNPNCGWSRRVIIPANENSTKRKVEELRTKEREHSYAVRGCRGEISLIQTEPLHGGGDVA